MCPRPHYTFHSPALAYFVPSGVEVPSDKVGVLQDVHWACGAIGYFPSYSLVRTQYMDLPLRRIYVDNT
jgi:hypothetical protein